MKRDRNVEPLCYVRLCLKLILVPHAHLPKIIDLLNEKVAMGIREPIGYPVLKPLFHDSEEEWVTPSHSGSSTTE